MKRPSLKPLLWLTALVGCSGLITGTPQPVSGQTHSPVLSAQRTSQPQDREEFSPMPPEFEELEEAKRLEQQVTQLYQQGKYNGAIRSK